MNGFGGLGRYLGGSWASSWKVLVSLWRVLEGLGGVLGRSWGVLGSVRVGKGREDGGITLKGGVWGTLWMQKSIQEGKKSKKRRIKQES